MASLQQVCMLCGVWSYLWWLPRALPHHPAPPSGPHHRSLALCYSFPSHFLPSITLSPPSPHTFPILPHHPPPTPQVTTPLANVVVMDGAGSEGARAIARTLRAEGLYSSYVMAVRGYWFFLCGTFSVSVLLLAYIVTGNNASRSGD